MGPINCAPNPSGVVAKSCNRTESATHTAIAEWIRPESTENDGSVRFSDTGI